VSKILGSVELRF